MAQEQRTPKPARRAAHTGHAPDLDQLVTIREAAEQLGVNYATVRRYIASGRLTSYRLGPKMIRVNQADLDKLLAPIPTVVPKQSAPVKRPVKRAAKAAPKVVKQRRRKAPVEPEQD